MFRFWWSRCSRSRGCRTAGSSGLPAKNGVSWLGGQECQPFDLCQEWHESNRLQMISDDDMIRAHTRGPCHDDDRDDGDGDDDGDAEFTNGV